MTADPVFANKDKLVKMLKSLISNISMLGTVQDHYDDDDYNSEAVIEIQEVEQMIKELDPTFEPRTEQDILTALQDYNGGQ